MREKLKIHTRSRARSFCDWVKKRKNRMISARFPANYLKRVKRGKISIPAKRGKTTPRLMNIDEWACTNLAEARQSKLSEAATELLIRVTPPFPRPVSPLTPSGAPKPQSRSSSSLQLPQVGRKILSARRRRARTWDFLRHIDIYFTTSLCVNIKSMARCNKICEKKVCNFFVFK